MPRGDRTGPAGAGRGTGFGRGQGGQGRGRMGGNSPGAGPSGYCVCPHCGKKIAHRVASPCYQIDCPKCGAKMARE